MTLLEKAKIRQKELNIGGTLSLSDKPDKKLVLRYNGKNIHFGLKGSSTFLEGADPSRRKAYRARHSKVLLQDGTPAYKSRYSPSFLSYHILW